MDLKTLIDTISILKKTPIGQKASEKVSDKLKLTDAQKEEAERLKGISTLNQINSIKGKAKKSIAQYPVLMSESISNKVSPVILNALEVEYASLVAMIIQNTSSYSSGDAGSVIGTFHNRSIKESTFMCGADSVVSLHEACKELVKPYDENHKAVSLNEAYYNSSMMKYLTEADKYEDEKEDRAKEKHKWDRNKNTRDEDKYDEDKERNKKKDAIEAEKNRRDREKHNDEKARNKEKDQRDRDRDQRDREKFESEKKRGGNVLTSLKDIAKINDMHPTILEVEVSFTADTGNITKKISVGVKCIGHLIKATDIEYYLTKASYKNNPFLKLIKWTTGEISFWKDLMFAFDEVKNDAKQDAKAGSKNYFSKLEFIAKQSKNLVVSGAKLSEIPTAITTLVISTTDVENIKYKNGINILSNPEYLKKIFRAFYLLNILIVDENLDVVYSYDADNNTIERYPISSFERASKERKVDANDLYKLLK